MRKWKRRLVCPVLSLLIWSAPAKAQVYWDYKTAYLAYDRGDFTLAADMYKRLAAEGNKRAQNDLAFLYEVGQGVSPDPKKASMWYHKSAEQGHGPAQYRIADLYLAGKGVKQDSLEAHKWFSLASLFNRNEGQRSLARNRLDNLAARLTGIQLTIARRRACDWWRSYQKKSTPPHLALAGCDAE